MKLGLIIALALAILIGLSLGTLGAGGSILTLPILIYLAGISVQKAVGMSLVVVGGTSLLGAVLHYRQGNFHKKATILFSSTGIPGAFFGSKLTHTVSDKVLLLIFAGLMLAAGVAMLRKRSGSEGGPRCHILRCLFVGAAVGVVTGFLGVGGGFMIVPALVLFAGIETKKAIGASLAIITLNAGAGLVGQLRHTSFDWLLALGFLGLALMGMLIGLVVAEKVSGQTLNKSFAWFIIGIALMIGALNIFGVTLPSSK